jgi:hypothetical protein
VKLNSFKKERKLQEKQGLDLHGSKAKSLQKETQTSDDLHDGGVTKRVRKQHPTTLRRQRNKTRTKATA